ncbi:MAG TPA: LysE family transporter [Gaiellaceae bacterium]|jgi:putative LysE/RhtB family amino acid efflux pump
MSSLIVGFGLGLFVAAQIGPVSLLIVRSVVRGDFWIGMAMSAAVALVDLGYAGLGLAGVGSVLENTGSVRVVLGVVGAGILVAIGLRAIWIGFRARFGLETEEEVGTPRRAFFTALAATAFNPLTIALWTVAAPAAVSGGRSSAGTAALLVGVGAGTLTWYTGFSGAVAIARRRLGPSLLAIVDIAAGAGLVAFGGLMALRTVRD